MNFIKLLVTTSLLIFSAVSLSKTLEQEKAEYLKIYQNGNYPSIREAMGEMTWSGITDEAIFDLLLEEYKKREGKIDKASIDQISWLALGLGLSGNDKYKAVIKKDLEATNNKKLKKHFNNALIRFENHQKWNPIIIKDVAKAEDAEIQRIKNMLNSDVPELVRVGGKRIYFGYSSNQELVDLASKRLMEISATAKDRVEVDAAAWLAKGIVQTGDSKYKADLDKIAADAPSKKLRKYAKKFSQQL